VLVLSALGKFASLASTRLFCRLWGAEKVLCWSVESMTENGKSRKPDSRAQVGKMHGFTPALFGTDADYTQTAGDQVLV
jgi:hypothetical protein